MIKNFCGWRNFEQAINEAIGEFDFSTLRQFLWKDEIGDVFLLTRYMEIYLYSKTTLRCYCWSSQKRFQLIRKGTISNIWATDDDIHTFDTDIKNLHILIALGKPFKRRPYLKGNWIKNMEKRLGHRIKPFEPLLQKTELPSAIHDKERGQEHLEEFVLV